MIIINKFKFCPQLRNSNFDPSALVYQHRLKPVALEPRQNSSDEIMMGKKIDRCVGQEIEIEVLESSSIPDFDQFLKIRSVPVI